MGLFSHLRRRLFCHREVLEIRSGLNGFASCLPLFLPCGFQSDRVFLG